MRHTKKLKSIFANYVDRNRATDFAERRADNITAAVKVTKLNTKQHIAQKTPAWGPLFCLADGLKPMGKI